MSKITVQEVIDELRTVGYRRIGEDKYSRANFVVKLHPGRSIDEQIIVTYPDELTPLEAWTSTTGECEAKEAAIKRGLSEEDANSLGRATHQGIYEKERKYRRYLVTLAMPRLIGSDSVTDSGLDPLIDLLIKTEAALLESNREVRRLEKKLGVNRTSWRKELLVSCCHFLFQCERGFRQYLKKHRMSEWERAREAKFKKAIEADKKDPIPWAMGRAAFERDKRTIYLY